MTGPILLSLVTSCALVSSSEIDRTCVEPCEAGTDSSGSLYDSDSGQVFPPDDSDGPAPGDSEGPELPTDMDGDGYPEDEDCDDSNPAVNPGASEICGDLIDNDCDGTSGECGLSGEASLLTAAGRVHGNNNDASVGNALADLGDTTGDGQREFVLGAHWLDGAGTEAGAVYVLRTLQEGLAVMSEVATSRILGENEGDNFGRIVAGVGDVTGDGLGDLLVSAPKYGDNQGMVYLIRGPFTGSPSVSDAVATMTKAASYTFLGGHLSGGTDVDGFDGPEILIADEYYDSNRGVVYVVGAPSGNSIDLDTSSKYRIEGESQGGYMGYGLSSHGDLDGDGIYEIAVGAYVMNSGEGKAYILRGPLTGNVNLADADLSILGNTGEAAYAGYDLDTAGDVDGDGYDDIAVAMLGANNTAGSVLVFAGSSISKAGTDEFHAGEATAQIMGAVDSGYAGRTTTWLGDTDADGRDDLAVSAYHAYDTPDYGGVVGVFLGPLEGNIDFREANAQYKGESSSASAGTQLVRAGDTNGDGYDDFMVGAPYTSTADTFGGAAYLLLGQGL